MLLKHSANKTLSAVISVLLVLTILSGILVCGTLTTVFDQTPSVEFCIDLAQADRASAFGPVTLSAARGPAVLTAAKQPVSDAVQTWTQQTSVDLFKAAYDNASGQVTVQSAYGDKVIAPGTANSYYFYVRNNSASAIQYTVETTAQLTVSLNGETWEIPLEARFYNTDGEYLVGTESEYDAFSKLHGVVDTGALSVNHYTRYTLDWQWPYESGNDDLDTLLGNMDSQEDSVHVALNIKVTATGDDDASGGSPDTGDSGSMGLWITVMAVSALLAVTLFARRKNYHEKETY